LLLPLILASTSPYRKELLQKLNLPFQSQAPICDEDFYKKDIHDPVKLASVLAEQKALSLATKQNCVIGGDQVAALGNEILGKPKSFEKACEQLEKMQGKTHRLITAICVICQEKKYPILDITEIKMRALSREQIEAYVHLDNPLDCAGSYKIEKSGMILMDEIKSQDFSAIQGIPLIELVKLLTKLGYDIPGQKLTGR
jgi:septum formation protein